MKLLERLALIKAGYTKKEIAAIEAAEIEDQAAEPDGEQGEEVKDEPAGDPEAEEPEQDEPDYKTLYKQAKSQLEAAQKVNIRVSVKDAETKTDDEAIADIITDMI